MTLGLMPSLNQVTGINEKGEFEMNFLTQVSFHSTLLSYMSLAPDVVNYTVNANFVLQIPTK